MKCGIIGRSGNAATQARPRVVRGRESRRGGKPPATARAPRAPQGAPLGERALPSTKKIQNKSSARASTFEVVGAAGRSRERPRQAHPQAGPPRCLRCPCRGRRGHPEHERIGAPSETLSTEDKKHNNPREVSQVFVCARLGGCWSVSRCALSIQQALLFCQGCCLELRSAPRRGGRRGWGLTVSISCYILDVV